MKKLFLLIWIFVMVFSGGFSYALSSDQIKAFQSGVYYFNTEDTTCSTVSSLQGNDNIQQAFNHFITKGFTQAQSAGIVGNLIQESGVNPLRDQIGGGPGRGIAQWEYKDPPDKGRWNVLLEYAASRGDPRSLAIQLDFIMVELNSNNYISAMNSIKASTTVKDATDLFLTGYERAGIPNETGRVDKANGVLTLYGSSVNGLASDNQKGCGSPCLIDTSSTLSNISSVRSNVVCLAQQELTIWTPTYDKQNYLKYSQKYPQQWCADFASWIYDQAGYPLGTEPNWRFAAVFDIKQIGDKNLNFHYHDSTSYTPQPGDLAIHYRFDPSTKVSSYYHVNIVVEVNVITKSLTLIGGDEGSGPYGGINSQSVVAKDTTVGFSSSDIVGYVSPD